MLHYGPTYIWRPDSGPSEQNMFSRNFVQWLLREPALSEAVFAAARRQVAFEAQSETESPLSSMQHYNKAISLLQRRVSEASAAFDDAIYWAVIALLVSDQEREDWHSYAVNLDGIRRIVQIRGGVKALKASCGRSFKFYLWAESCCSNREDLITQEESEQVSTTPIPAVFEAPLEDLVPFVRRHSPGFVQMIEQHPFHCETMTMIDSTLKWYHAQTCATNGGRSPQEGLGSRNSLTERLHRLLQKGAISDRERLVCVGLLVLVLTLPPVYMSEQYSRTLSRYVSGFQALSGSIAQEDCTLWVALMMASMSVCFGLAPTTRWMLLDHVVASETHPRSWRMSDTWFDNSAPQIIWKHSGRTAGISWSLDIPKVSLTE